MKKKFIIALLAIFIFLISCDYFTIPLQALEIDGPETVDINQTVQLTVTPVPARAKVNVEWSSSDPDIAIVDSDGYVTGLAEGDVVITATSVDYPNVFASIEITVTEPAIESLTVQGPKEVYVGATITVTAVITPEYISQAVTYISSDQRIMTVDQAGKVTGVAPGTATLLVYSKYQPSVFTSYAIEVLPREITELAIMGKNELYVTETAQLTAHANDNTINALVDWSSSNPEVVTVDAEGIVRAISAGTTTIRAVLKDNSEVYDEFAITVIYLDKLYFHTKILSIDRNERKMELLNVPYPEYDANIRVLRKNGAGIKPASIDDLYIGMENVYAEVDIAIGKVFAILIDGETGFANIRVGIRYSINDIADENTLYHDYVSLKLLKDVTLQTYDGEESVELLKDQSITATISDDKIVIKRGATVVLKTAKRVIFIPKTPEEAIKITSIQRGSNATYAGNIEISLYDHRLLVVNDINIEQYLYKVVPSEMPASYNSEALKAQAIAARTFAYADAFSRRNEHKGYTVDDSVNSQVYNSVNAAIRTNDAVDATRGMVMMNGGQLITAYYYSTSSGLTASAHEVWITDGFDYPDPTPYLIGRNLTEDESGQPITFDHTDEASMLSFFKTIRMTTPDSNAIYHRWRVTFSKDQLTATLNANLRNTYQATPNLVLTETSQGWASLPISESIGAVTSVYVGERGSSGVVISLIVETTSGKYKIVNQYSIRFTIRPRDGGGVIRRDYARGTDDDYTGSVQNDSTLLSGFFAIEQDGDDFVFYGGGYGHGVGMSQNGANGYAARGYDYEQILTAYYQAIELVDISYQYQPLTDYEEYFSAN